MVEDDGGGKTGEPRVGLLSPQVFYKFQVGAYQPTRLELQSLFLLNNFVVDSHVLCSRVVDDDFKIKVLDRFFTSWSNSHQNWSHLSTVLSHEATSERVLNHVYDFVAERFAADPTTASYSHVAFKYIMLNRNCTPQLLSSIWGWFKTNFRKDSRFWDKLNVFNTLPSLPGEVVDDILADSGSVLSSTVIRAAVKSDAAWVPPDFLYQSYCDGSGDGLLTPQDLLKHKNMPMERLSDRVGSMCLDDKVTLLLNKTPLPVGFVEKIYESTHLSDYETLDEYAARSVSASFQLLSSLLAAHLGRVSNQQPVPDLVAAGDVLDPLLVAEGDHLSDILGNPNFPVSEALKYFGDDDGRVTGNLFTSLATRPQLSFGDKMLLWDFIVSHLEAGERLEGSPYSMATLFLTLSSLNSSTEMDKVWGYAQRCEELLNNLWDTMIRSPKLSLEKKNELLNKYSVESLKIFNNAAPYDPNRVIAIVDKVTDYLLEYDFNSLDFYDVSFLLICNTIANPCCCGEKLDVIAGNILGMRDSEVKNILLKNLCKNPLLPDWVEVFLFLSDKKVE